MASPYIEWTFTSSQNVDFPFAPVRFQGYPVTDAVTSVSKSGKAVTVVHDSHMVYDVEVSSLLPRSTHATFFQKMSGWWAHASRGGEFAFHLDKDLRYATTLSGAEAIGQTALSVTSSTNFAAAQWIYLEDAVDPTLNEYRLIDSKDTGVITVNAAITVPLSSGSVVRHADSFPKCVVEDPGSPPWLEREGGRGANVWDLKFRFRTVR